MPKHSRQVMLAYNGEWTDKDFNPKGVYWIQNKFDGVLAYHSGAEGLKMRTGYNVPNKYIREKFQDIRLNYMEGELILPGADFHITSGVVRSHDDPRGRDIVWVVFDYVKYVTDPYEKKIL